MSVRGMNLAAATGAALFIVFSRVQSLECPFPDVSKNPGLLCATGDHSKDCWATTNVAPGSYLPYFCQSGWLPSPSFSQESGGFGVFCSKDGDVKVNMSVPMCQPGINNLKFNNGGSSEISVCERVGEAELNVERVVKANSGIPLPIFPFPATTTPSEFRFLEDSSHCQSKENKDLRGDTLFTVLGQKRASGSLLYTLSTANKSTLSSLGSLELRCVKDCFTPVACRCSAQGCQQQVEGTWWSPSGISCTLDMGVNGDATLTQLPPDGERSVSTSESAGQKQQQDNALSGGQINMASPTLTLTTGSPASNSVASQEGPPSSESIVIPIERSPSPGYPDIPISQPVTGESTSEERLNSDSSEFPKWGYGLSIFGFVFVVTALGVTVLMVYRHYHKKIPEEPQFYDTDFEYWEVNTPRPEGEPEVAVGPHSGHRIISLADIGPMSPSYYQSTVQPLVNDESYLDPDHFESFGAINTPSTIVHGFEGESPRGEVDICRLERDVEEETKGEI